MAGPEPGHDKWASSENCAGVGAEAVIRFVINQAPNLIVFVDRAFHNPTLVQIISTIA